MIKKVSFNYKREKIEFDAINCISLQRFSGLMFKSKEKAEVLLFDFKKPTRQGIHSFFVFFPFIAVWLDEKNKIIEMKKIKPFLFFIRPKKHFSKLLEIPINKKYKGKLKLLVGD